MKVRYYDVNACKWVSLRNSEPCVIPGFEEFEFSTGVDPKNKYNTYGVTEGSTGYRIPGPYADTRESAMAYARATLELAGKDKLIKAMDKAKAWLAPVMDKR